MISIRQFQPADGAAARGLFRHGQEDFAESYLQTEADRAGFHEFVDGAITRDLADIQQSYVERRGSNFWIAERAGEPVGCIGLYRRSDEEAEIRRLAVDRNARRMGIASQLLDQAEEFARDAGYARTTVWTANHLTAATSFLDSRGYTEIEDHAFPDTSLSLHLYALSCEGPPARLSVHGGVGQWTGKADFVAVGVGDVIVAFPPRGIRRRPIRGVAGINYAAMVGVNVIHVQDAAAPPAHVGVMGEDQVQVAVADYQGRETSVGSAIQDGDAGTLMIKGDGARHVPHGQRDGAD